MDNIGAEVGQKMRSAIKAKLMELGCYVDDELPDYIMVMVANKRTKSQMNEDLHLFLSNKTTAFVEWLQVVLKKLKEITVTNPDIYKRVSKRKGDDSPKPTIKVKKEKKEKAKSTKKIKKKEPLEIVKDIPQVKSLTDDLPVQASKLSEMRKIVIMQENQNNNSNTSNVEDVNEDSFDIPPLSEVAISNDIELAEIEKKIRSVKSRLGLQVPSDSEDEDFLNIKVEPDELFTNDASEENKQISSEDKTIREVQVVGSQSTAINPESTAPLREPSPKQKIEHPRIVFGNEPVKKQSALERLGKRSIISDGSYLPKRNKINLTNVREEEEKILGISTAKSVDSSPRNTLQIEKERHYRKEGVDNRKSTTKGPPRESALKRLGVMSKVAVPQKEIVVETNTEEVINKDVPSSVRVKPRVLPPPNNQANKNLLLKAVADAQRSIAQTPIIGANKKPDALFTKRYKEKDVVKKSKRRILTKDKDRIRSILTSQIDKKDSKREIELSSDDDNLEYVPKPVKKASKSNEQLAYVPSVKDQLYAVDDNCINMDSTDYNIDVQPKGSKSQTFIITLDGIERRQDLLPSLAAASSTREVISEEFKKKRSPSPIIFHNAPSANTKIKQVSDKLPVVHSQSSMKVKEKCKYWPACRQGDKCEFIHPTTTCKAFPLCKFGDKCLYIHPACKFETSCTRKDCPYSHSPRTFNNAPSASLQMCRFFPNCNNIHCTFYHPKPCKFGKHCKNPTVCNYSHDFYSKNNLTWRSTVAL